MRDEGFSDAGNEPDEQARDGGEPSASPDEIAEVERRFEEAREAWFRSRGLEPHDD